MEERQNDTGSGKIKYSVNDYLCATLSTMHPTRNVLGSNSGRRGFRPTINTKLEARSSCI